MSRATAIRCPECGAPTQQKSLQPSGVAIERIRFCEGCPVVVTTRERIVGRPRHRKPYWSEADDMALARVLGRNIPSST